MLIKNMFVSALLIAAAMSSEPQNIGTQNDEFKGNWTREFQTTTPYGPAIHTPTYVQLGWFLKGKKISSAGGIKINGHAFANDLNLDVNSTVEEFVAALVFAGIHTSPQ